MLGQGSHKLNPSRNRVRRLFVHCPGWEWLPKLRGINGVGPRYRTRETVIKFTSRVGFSQSAYPHWVAWCRVNHISNFQANTDVPSRSLQTTEHELLFNFEVNLTPQILRDCVSWRSLFGGFLRSFGISVTFFILVSVGCRCA